MDTRHRVKHGKRLPTGHPLVLAAELVAVAMIE
jgi:hypothetical protein